MNQKSGAMSKQLKALILITDMLFFDSLVSFST